MLAHQLPRTIIVAKTGKPTMTDRKATASSVSRDGSQANRSTVRPSGRRLLLDEVAEAAAKLMARIP